MFSKYAWTAALNRKNANEVTRAIKSVLDAVRKPKIFINLIGF